MPLTRTALIDDDGTGTTGTVLNNAWYQAFCDAIDALAVNPTSPPTARTDVSNTFALDQKFTTALFEKGRTTAIGHWKAYPYSAGNFTANVGAWTVDAGDVIDLSYMLVGKTLFLGFNLLNTSVSGSPTQLRITLPDTLVSAPALGGGTFFYSQDGNATFLAGALVGVGSQLTFYRDLTNLTAWAAATNATAIRGLAIIPVQ